MFASSVPLHAQESGQPDGSGQFDVPGLPIAPDGPSVPVGDQSQQLIDQIQNGQFPTMPAAGSGLPSEATIAQLREALDKAMVVERQRELFGDTRFGDSVDPSITQLQLNLLTQDYEQNILPTLQNATQNCLIAELGYTKAADWVLQVQKLGLGDAADDKVDVGAAPEDAPPSVNGPLYAELQNVQGLFLQILQNCDKEVYNQCVRDDTDPNADYLAAFLRQLSYIDDNIVYQERWSKCQTGWHGTLTIHEELTGSSSSRQAASNGTTTLNWDTSGTRDFSLERANKVAGTSGTSKGHSVTTRKTVTTDSKCTVTQTLSTEVNGGGTGDAALRKVSTGDDAILVLSFIGPNEPGGVQHTTQTTQSNCGGAASAAPIPDVPLPEAPYQGHIADKLSSPLAETTSGSQTMLFTISSSGSPVLTQLQSSQGSTATSSSAGSQDGATVTPWLARIPTIDVSPNSPPKLRVTINWNLQFG